MPMVLRYALISIAVMVSPLAHASYAEACVLEGEVVSEVSVSDGGAPEAHFSMKVETARRDDTSPIVPDADCSFWVGQIASITLRERVELEAMPRPGSKVRVLTEAVVGGNKQGEVMLRSFRLLVRLHEAASVPS